jgi:hypothetical protein
VPYTLSLGDQRHAPRPYLLFRTREQMVRWVLRVVAMLEREGTAGFVLCVVWEEEGDPAC